MQDQFADAIAEFGPTAVIALLVLARKGFKNAWAPVLVAALFLADTGLLDIRAWLPGIHVPAGNWNWEGKGAAFLFALAALAVLPERLWAQVGLFAVPRRSAWLPLTLLSLVICGLVLARTVYFGAPEPFRLETIAFQATLPGLHEELTFHGVWWVLFALALDPGRIADGKIPWWTLLATTVLFGAVHAVDLTQQGALTINWPFFAATAMSGFLYGLLQGIGRTVWIPILVHNLANTIIYAWQMSLPQVSPAG
jgi:hypothetical protein